MSLKDQVLAMVTAEARGLMERFEAELLKAGKTVPEVAEDVIVKGIKLVAERMGLDLTPKPEAPATYSGPERRTGAANRRADAALFQNSMVNLRGH